MQDLLNSLPAPAAPAGRWWPMRIAGDMMAPTLNAGDVAIVVPCHAYEGPGVYAFHDGGEEFVQRCDWAPGGKIKLIADNAAYGSGQTADTNWFEMSVIGRVAGIVKPI